MTITYTRKVATCTGLGVFWKLLFRWKGSIYKLVWQNLLLYLILYYILSLTYRLLLDEKGKEKFEQIALHCQKFSDLIPVTFVLGFYVSIVITRWWGQYKIIPWPDSCCLFISTCILGHDDRGRLMRRTIARYLIVALIQTLRMTSIQVKKRFPTLNHLSDAGIITESEKKIIESLDEKCIQHPKYWMSLVWAGAVVTRAKKEGRIKDDFAFQTIIKEINKFRSGCGGLLDYDWISIPLVYTQVVTLAVYTFFISSLMGRQFLDPEKKLEGHEVDIYVPVFTFLQFFFYMGWLKVAEALINPFGEDDDDFEMNWLIDRNLQVAYLIVDEMHAEHPELVKDQFWDEGIPDELPYTVAAEQFRADPWIGSTAEVEVSPEQGEFIILDPIEEDVVSDDELNQIRIEDVKPTIPVSIKNGKLVNNMSIGSESSLHESLVTLPVGSTGQSKNNNRSMMSMLQKIFPGSQASSRTNMNRIGSSLSIASNAVKRGGQRRRRKHATHSKSGAPLDRSTSKASALSNMSPFLSRIHTNEQEFQFKMSETSSVNSPQESDSELPTRRNSDAKALNEVRELLRNDLQRYHENGKMVTGTGMMDQLDTTKEQGGATGDQSLDTSKSGRNSVSKQRKKEARSRAEHSQHTKLLKRKLEAVQNVQALIMKELEEELKMSYNSQDEVTDNLDTRRQITQSSQCDTRQEDSRATDTEGGAGSPLFDDSGKGRSLTREQGGNYARELSASITRDNGGALATLQLQLGLGGTTQNLSSPNSPVGRYPSGSHGVHGNLLDNPLNSLQPLNPISTAGSAKSALSACSSSNQSLAEAVFELENHLEPQNENRGSESGDDSETPSVIANPNLIYFENLEESHDGGTEKDLGSTIYNYDAESLTYPSNLGTIQELPELGYQSDSDKSSDTDLLLPGHRARRKNGGISDSDEGSDEKLTREPPLPTVPEEQSL